MISTGEANHHVQVRRVHQTSVKAKEESSLHRPRSCAQHRAAGSPKRREVCATFGSPRGQRQRAQHSQVRRHRRGSSEAAHQQLLQEANHIRVRIVWTDGHRLVPEEAQARRHQRRENHSDQRSRRRFDEN